MTPLERMKTLGLIESNGHYIHTKRHYSDWVHRERLAQNPELLHELSLTIAERFKEERVEAVIGFGTGAYGLALFTALELTRMHSGGEIVLSIATERGPGEAPTLPFVSQREVKDRRVLVVDSVVDSGHTVKRIVELVRRSKGDVVGAAAICNRGTTTVADLGNVPRFEFLAQLAGKSWDPLVCAKRGPCSAKCTKVIIGK